MALRNQLDRQRNKLTLERNKIDPERNQHPRIRNKPQTPNPNKKEDPTKTMVILFSSMLLFH